MPQLLLDILSWIFENVGAVITALISTLVWYFWRFMSEMKDREALSKYRLDLTKESRWEDTYQRRLKTGLALADRFWGEKLLGGKAFVRCWSIAFIYPIALFLLTWGFTGQYRMSGWALMPHGWSGLARASLVLVLVLYGFGVHRLFQNYEEAAQSVIRLLDRMRLLSQFQAQTRGFILSGIPGAIVGIGLYLKTGDIAFAGALAGAVAFGFAIVVAVAFDIAGARGFAVLITSAAFGIFGFAVTATGTVILMGAYAFAISVIVAGVVINSEAAAELVAAVSIIVPVVSIPAVFLTGGVHEGIVSLVLFFGLLPLFNAFLDFLSWAISRRLGRSLRDHYHKYKAFLWWFLDFLIAAMLVVALVLLLSIGLESLNNLRGEMIIDLDGLIQQVLTDPWGEGLWITTMLISTLLPTALHLSFVMFSFVAMPLSPTKRTEWLSEIKSVLSAAEDKKKLNPRTRRNIAEYLVLHRLAVLVLSGLVAFVVIGLVAYSIGLLPGVGSITGALAEVAEVGRTLVR